MKTPFIEELLLGDNYITNIKDMARMTCPTLKVLSLCKKIIKRCKQNRLSSSPHPKQLSKTIDHDSRSKLHFHFRRPEQMCLESHKEDKFLMQPQSRPQDHRQISKRRYSIWMIMISIDSIKGREDEWRHPAARYYR